MARKTPFNEAEAAECAGSLAEIADRGRLAALGLAQPVLVARRVQLEREQLRLRTRRGEADPRAARLDRSIALAAGRIDEVEIATEVLTVDTPTAPEEGGAVFGRVTERGHGRRDLVVSVVDPEGKVTGFACTGPSGAFEVRAPSGSGLRLRVTDKDGAVLWRDADSFKLADGDVIRREIDLAAAGPECPSPGDDEGGPSKTVKVPDLIGRAESEALRILRAAGLEPGTRTVEESPEQAGRIVGQSPESGAEAGRGSAVDYVVGVEAQLEMPDLRGVALEEALARIKELGLAAEDPTFSPSAEFEGRVIQHTPAAGEPVRPGDPVVLLVGSAPRVTMPDLRGVPLDEARKRLEELGLVPGDPTFVPDAERAGLVVSHTPQPGASVAPGTTVTLVVGTKPEEETVTVPDLRGRMLEEALKILDTLGLEAGETTRVPAPDQVGRVIRHDPGPGAVVPRGTAVALVVGGERRGGSERVTMPNLVGRTLEEALKVLENIGQKPDETTFVQDPRRAGQVIRQSPAEGSLLSADVAIRLVVATGNDERDLRSAVSLTARNPAVGRLDLSADEMVRRLDAAGVSSLDGLAEIAGSDASARRVFGLRTIAEARRLRTALKTAMAGMR